MPEITQIQKLHLTRKHRKVTFGNSFIVSVAVQKSYKR